MTNANLMASTIQAAQGMLKLMETDVKFASAMIEQDVRFNQLPVEWRLNTIKAARIARTWRSEGRQTLTIHPEIVRVASLASSSKMPMELLRALPYICPMVVFADPPKIPSWRKYRGDSDNELMPYAESQMRILGYLTYSFSQPIMPDGRVVSIERQCQLIDEMVRTTHDPLTTDFGAIVMFEILDDAGRRVDMEATSISMPFNQYSTLKELVDDQAERFVFAGETEYEARGMAQQMAMRGKPEFNQVINQISKFSQDKERVKPWFREVFKTVLGSLMYLCSTTLDAEKVPASTTRKLGTTTMARRPLSLYRVGWTTGAALSKMRQERAMLGEPSEMGDLAHQQDPQHRRAHFKTVWSGPGKTIPKTAFVSPYWTHRERLGDTGVNTARRVV
jgi:hypothetical protein